MRKNSLQIAILSIVLVLAVAFNLTGCSTAAQAADLMKGIKAGSVSGKTADDRFLGSQAELAAELFRASALESRNNNVLISPLSIQLALAMTANGANGQTKEEMEKLLGGELTIEELNEYLYAYVKSLPSGDEFKLEIADSIWFRDDEDSLRVKEDFLRTNADYYGAQAYKAPFDEQTVKDINAWVDEHTDGMIDKIVDEISPDTVMYLINALVFDAEWETAYYKSDIYDGTFNAVSGDERTVRMMRSEEGKYLDDGKATGFIKQYKGGEYSFAALLPNEGVDIYDYIAGMTGESLTDTLKTAQNKTVQATMPKFSYEYELGMKKVLSELGMPSAFNGNAADFSRMASSSRGNIFISDVLHKTFISVDELGTKAGAVTKVEMKTLGAAPTERTVKLDRPFVYMIIDNSANLPVFIGAVMDIGS